MSITLHVLLCVYFNCINQTVSISGPVMRVANGLEGFYGLWLLIPFSLMKKDVISILREKLKVDVSEFSFFPSMI